MNLTFKSDDEDTEVVELIWIYDMLQVKKTTEEVGEHVT